MATPHHVFPSSGGLSDLCSELTTIIVPNAHPFYNKNQVQFNRGNFIYNIPLSHSWCRKLSVYITLSIKLFQQCITNREFSAFSPAFWGFAILFRRHDARLRVKTRGPRVRRTTSLFSLTRGAAASLIPTPTGLFSHAIGRTGEVHKTRSTVKRTSAKRTKNITLLASRMSTRSPVQLQYSTTKL